MSCYIHRMFSTSNMCVSLLWKSSVKYIYHLLWHYTILNFPHSAVACSVDAHKNYRFLWARNSKCRYNQVHGYVPRTACRTKSHYEGWYNSIERVEEFKYLGTTLTNQNPIQKEIKSRLKLGNACYHSAQKLMSSSLLSKNLKIKIYRTIIFPVVLYGCETWSLTLREEHRLRVFENRVLRRIFGPKRDLSFALCSLLL